MTAKTITTTTATTAIATLYYIHDPMCSWCWGFRPTWNQLKQLLPNTVALINLTGGLAPDSDDLMPIKMQLEIQGYWRTIEKQLGTPFNFDFWKNNQPRRATYMACRATIAANYQHAQNAMIDGIQQAYYLRALNPSDITILVQIAEEQGLDREQFQQDLLSPETQIELERQMKLARTLPIHGFPSLVLEVNNTISAIELDYLHADTMLAQINSLMTQID